MTSRSPLFSNYLFYAFLAILIWAPLPKAGHPPWAMNLQSTLILSLAVVLLLTALVQGRDWLSALKPHWPALSLFLLVPLYVTLQCIPLPQEWVAALSPESAALQARVGLERYTISLDPGFTRQMALTSWSLWVIFALTLMLVDSTARVRILIMTVVFTGVFQALYGGYMTLSGVEYGFLAEKQGHRGSATGTFAIRNNLAAYLAMCLSLGIGLMLATLDRGQRQRNWQETIVKSVNVLLGPKMRLRVYLAVMVIGLVLTKSRMGNTAFFVALPLCGFIWMLLERKIHKGALILFVSLILVDVLIVSQWFGLERLADRIQSTSLEEELRPLIIRDAMKMLDDYAVTGSGAGTFGTVFTRYSDLGRDSYAKHATMDYLEFATTLGLLGFIPLALTVFYALWMSVRAMRVRNARFMKGLGFGTLMAMTCLLIHSFTDFNLQMPANALLIVVVLALVHVANTLERGGSRTARSGASEG